MQIPRGLPVLRQDSNRARRPNRSPDCGGREGLLDGRVSPQKEDGGGSIPRHEDIRDPRRKISIEEILTTVAWHADITVFDVKGPVRKKGYARWRQLAHALCRDLTTGSLPQIGRASNRDHTTILHSIRAVQKRREQDPETDRIYNSLRRRILMSANNRQKNPSVKRDTYQVAHVTFEISRTDHSGPTFALIAGEALHPKDRRPLFTGHVNDQMPAQLRQLAYALENMIK